MAASTLTEVARLAGVSPATASRVLNGSARKPGTGHRRAGAPGGGFPGLHSQRPGPGTGEVQLGPDRPDRPRHRRSLLRRDRAGRPGGGPRTAPDGAAGHHSRGSRGREGGRGRLCRAPGRFDRHRRLAVVAGRGRRTATPTSPPSWTGTAATAARSAVVGHPVVGASATEGYHVVAVPNEELAGRLAAALAGSPDNGDFVIIGGPEGLFTSDDRIRGFQHGLAGAGRPPAEVLRHSFNRAGGYDAGLALAARIKASRTGSAGPEAAAAVHFRRQRRHGHRRRCRPADGGPADPPGCHHRRV